MESSLWAYLMLSCLVIIATTYWKLSVSLVKGLKMYLVAKDPDADEEPQVKVVQKVRKRKGKKGEPDVSSEVDLDLGIVAMPEHLVQQMRFYHLYDQVVTVAAVVLVNAGVVEVSAAVGIPLKNGFLGTWGFLLVAAALRGIIAPEMDVNTTPPGERQLCYIAAVVGFGVSLALLLFAPTTWLDFGVQAATKSIVPSIEALIRERGGAMAERLSSGVAGSWMDLHPMQVKGLLAVVGGMLAGCVLAPAVRLMRCYTLATQPPEWAEGVLGAGSVARGVLHLNTLLPIPVLLAWSPALAPADVWLGATPAQMDSVVRPLLLVAVAVAQASAFRPCVQAYVDTAFVTWYELKHESTEGADGKEVGWVIRHKVHLIRELMCKVAIQVLVSPCVLLGCAVILRAQAAGEAGGTEGASGETGAVAGALVAPAMWRAVAGFVAWWWTAAWFAVTAIFLTGHRSGVLTG